MGDQPIQRLAKGKGRDQDTHARPVATWSRHAPRSLTRTRAGRGAIAGGRFLDSDSDHDDVS